MTADPMEVRLNVLVGRSAGQEIAVAGPTFLIGRADECQLRPKSEFISRRHCEIVVEESRVLIRDLGSRTGTFVNGTKIPPQRSVELKAGDSVKVGPLEFNVLVKHGLDRKKKPKVEGLDDIAARTAAGRDEIDVSQWLLADEAEEVSLGDTLMAAPGQTLVSAADLMGPVRGAGETVDGEKPATEKPASTSDDSRQAAADALRKHMRRG
jgi:pSer/pThr/pTyr-binding forkhead associated (FHA) protein